MQSRSSRPSAAFGRPLVIAAVACLTVLAFAEDAAAQRARIPTRNALKPYGLERMFLARASIDSRSDATRRISGDEEVVFVISKLGVVTAFDAESGRQLWTQLAGARPENISDVVTDIDTAYVIIAERLYAFDKLSGKRLWSLRIPFVPIAAPVFDEERMYVGTLDGSVYAFNLQKIREYRAVGEDTLNRYLDDTIAWRYRVGGSITSPPVLSDEAVCFTSDTGSLFGIRRTNREEFFQYETDKNVSAPLVAGDGIVYSASLDSTLYAIDMRSGTTLWEFVSGRRILEKPIVIGPSIYLSPLRSGLFRIAKEDGRKIWQSAELEQFLAASDERVYGRDRSGTIKVLDVGTGKTIADMPLRGFSVGFSNEKTDRIYLATNDGVLMGLRESDLEFPIFHKRPELKPILPPLADAAADEE